MASKTNNKNSGLSAFLAKHWWKIGILVLFIASVSFIGYNKYLDQQNVNNMKQLLADFEQLKTDAEKETGEAFYIEADCGTGGEKFKPVYSCKIALIPINLPVNLITERAYDKNEPLVLAQNDLCGKLSDLGFSGTEEFGNFYTCSVDVRNINQKTAEEIFYDYDTSPGRPF